MKPDRPLASPPRVLSVLAALGSALFSSALFSSDLLAQPSVEPAGFPANSLVLLGGASHYRLIDEAHTPRRLLLRGTPARFGLDFDRVAETYWFSASAAASAGHVESKPAVWRSELVALELSVSYARELAAYTLAGLRQRVFVGLSLDSEHYFLGDDQIPGNFDLVSFNGAHLELRQLAELGGRQSLSLGLSVPVFSLADRRSGGLDGNPAPDAEVSVSELLQGGELSLLPLKRFVTMQLDYRRMLSHALGVRVGYRFRYCSMPVGAPYDLYSNELNLALGWGF